MRFVDLFFVGQDLTPVEQQIFRSQIFEQDFASISKNRMSLWKSDNSFSKTGKSFLLGICPSWNLYDLCLLDCIAEGLAGSRSNEVFEVLDLDSLKNFEEEFPKIFGDFKKPAATPVLGIWNENVLSKSIWGWEAKDFLIDKFEFEWHPPKV